MGAGITAHKETQKTTRRMPTVGMRGGLGRTLLTAFLLLTLVLIGAYAAQQNKNNIEEETEAKILAIATLKGEALQRTSEELESSVASTLLSSHGEELNAYGVWWLGINFVFVG